MARPPEAEAVKLAEKPVQIVASFDVTVGNWLTVTLTVVVLLQPVAVLTPVIVYAVMPLPGLDNTILPVVAFKLVAGVQL